MVTAREDNYAEARARLTFGPVMIVVGLARWQAAKHLERGERREARALEAFASKLSGQTSTAIARSVVDGFCWVLSETRTPRRGAWERR